VEYSEAMDLLSRVLEGVGAAIIVTGLVLAAVRAWRVFSVHTDAPDADGVEPPARGTAAYVAARGTAGRGILLGLEVLVGADIIRTVAVTPTFDSVVVLGVVVLIRTFLSFSLSVEIDGALPWRRKPVPAR
jgi:uncharacterized membrane protein